MHILGIETSCDETAAAVIKNGTKILSNVVASSADMHTKTGGIIPEQAARQQVRSIIPVISDSLIKASEIGNWKLPYKTESCSAGEVGSNETKHNLTSHLSPLTSHIDAIAVTVGPGLIGSLLVGVETAKTLAFLWQKPIISVNHLPAHLYANWLMTKRENGKAGKSKLPKFPAIAMVVSGGHTDLVLMSAHGKLKWIGGTRDDAAGEAFDKTARLLGLPYPGGPSIAKSASNCPSLKNDSQSPIKLPRPTINENNFDFSFSGLKTAVLREAQKLESKNKLDEKNIAHLAAETQEAIVDVLVTKTLRAIKKFKPKSLLLAGGVAANKRLTEKFKLEIRNSNLKIAFHVPPPKLCTDNATYIASCAYFNNHPIPWQNIKAHPQLSITGES